MPGSSAGATSASSPRPSGRKAVGGTQQAGTLSRWLRSLGMDPPLCDLAADADGLLRAWCDGLAVVRLVELLEGRELTGVERAPRSTAQGMRNVEKALEVLRVRKGMPLTHLYHPHRLSKGEAASPAVCSICLSPVIALSESEFRTECCGNLFHKHCLARHKGYRSEASRSCPLCRSKAPTGLTPGRPKPVSQPTQPLFRTAAEERARRELGIPEDEPEEREQLAVLGYGPYAIARLAADPQYGPRAGMSDAARLLRAHDLDMLPAREDLPLAQSALLEEDEDEEDEDEEDEDEEDEESAGEEAEVVSREEEAEAPEPEEEAEASEEEALGEGEEEEAERNAVPVESP